MGRREVSESAGERKYGYLNLGSIPQETEMSFFFFLFKQVTVQNPENQGYLIAYKDSQLIVSSAK